MNIKQLFDQLNKIFPIQDEEIIFIESLDELSRNSLAPSLLTSFNIREILTSTPLNNEQKRNHLEAFLINKIKTEGSTQQKNTFKFALKLSLLSRGYFTDSLGRLEKQLLLLPCQDFLNPEIQFPDEPGNIHSLWQNINAIRLELFNCLEKPESYCSKLEKLAKLIRDILYKYQHLNPEPNTEKETLNTQEKNKAFLLNLINNALNLINDAMVQTNENEWSLWASAALESLDYHKDLKSQSEEVEEEQCIHRDRSKYFLTFLKAFNDPICVHLENQLSKYRYMNLSKCSENSLDRVEAFKNKETPIETTQKMRAIEEPFSEAYQLLSAEKKEPDFINRAIQYAIILENNGCSVGTFIRTAAYVLAEPLSLKQWSSHYETLQCIAIPYCWRSQISEIWLLLAEFFSKNYSESCVFYNDAFIACKKQIRNTNLSVNNVPRYSKQVQYQLCKYLLQTASDDIDIIDKSDLNIIIDELLNSENPYCLTEIVRILCSDSDLRETVSSAIQQKHCNEFTDPRNFCEQVLQKTGFNKYLIIWGPLTCSTGLNDRYIPVDLLTEETNISDAIQFKLCTQVRQQLRRVLNDQNETTMVIPCGFRYLKILEKKLYYFSSRLMPDLTKNTLYDAFNFTHNRKGLQEAIVALLYFYDGNYYAARKMAILSLKSHSTTSIELKPLQKSNPSSLPSVIGTPTHGSPERPRKLSPRLNVTALKNYSPTSPEISPRPNEPNSQLHNSRSITIPSLTKTIPQKILRDSDSSSPSSIGKTASPQFSLSPSRSPSGSIDIPHPISKSPRAPSYIAPKTGSASPLPMSLEQNYSSPLGHLIKAMILWETRLKNNYNRSRSEVVIFQQELFETQGCSVPDEERNFITGMRWLYYLMSKNPLTQKRDEIWLSDRDKAQFIEAKNDIKKDERRMLQIKEGQERDLDEYTLFKIARHYLCNKQTSENPNTKKFPPAVLIIFQFLKSYIDKYPNTKPHLIEKDLEDLARSLKDVVFIDGYFPAIPAYLTCYSLAHPPTLEVSEIITTGFTPADRVALIKNALIYSELYSPFPVHSTPFMTKQLELIEANEEQQLAVIRSYSVENLTAFNHRFNCLPIKICCRDSIISIDLIKLNETSVWQCRFITDDEDESSFINDLEPLQKLFQRAARVYSYCNKVNLSYDQIIFRQNNCLIITHADIAIIGFIFLVEGKLSIKLTPSEAAPLIELLNHAKALPVTTWQWKETYARLQNYVSRIQNSKTDDTARDLDPDELRSKLIPLSPSLEHGVSPRGHFSPPPTKQRSSLILANPRRGSNADLLANSLPSSPRGQQFPSLSKRDSGKVSIPDTSSGSNSGNRSRSVTESFLSRKK